MCKCRELLGFEGLSLGLLFWTRWWLGAMCVWEEELGAAEVLCVKIFSRSRCGVAALCCLSMHGP